MTSETNISPDFPFESKFIEINGSKMHYIEEGSGDPILFIHGNPTSSYLWRNVIPHLTQSGRCIAIDLIGMGKSDKPDLDYTFLTHYDYVNKFIEKLGLKNITLVIHDWGSGLGFHYASKHPDNIKAIAFMEAVYKPMEWNEIPADVRIPFRLMRAPITGFFLVSIANLFVKKMIPDMIKRKLTKEEFDTYKAPYPTIKSRKPIRVWPQMVPIGGAPKHMHDLVLDYQAWLKKTNIPKLCLSFDPGGIIKADGAAWIKENFPNITMVHLGEGLHFVQEDHPHAIGEAIKEWHAKL